MELVAFQEAQRGVCVRKDWIEAQRRFGSVPRTLKSYFGRKNLVRTAQDVGVGETGVRKRELRVRVDCLLEQIYRFLDRVPIPLIPIEATLEIELVRFGISSCRFRDATLLRGREPHAQRIGNPADDFLLDAQHIGALLVKAI